MTQRNWKSKVRLSVSSVCFIKWSWAAVTERNLCTHLTAAMFHLSGWGVNHCRVEPKLTAGCVEPSCCKGRSSAADWAAQTEERAGTKDLLCCSFKGVALKDLTTLYFKLHHQVAAFHRKCQEQFLQYGSSRCSIWDVSRCCGGSNSAGASLWVCVLPQVKHVLVTWTADLHWPQGPTWEQSSLKGPESQTVCDPAGTKLTDSCCPVTVRLKVLKDGLRLTRVSENQTS